MDHFTRVILLSPIFMLLFFHSKAANSPSTPVHELCSKRSNKGNCFSALEPNPITTSAANAPSKLVEELCSKTSKKGNCFSALEPDPRTTSVSTFLELAQIALELAVANTTASQTYIKNIQSNTPALKDAINDCVSSYGYAIGSFGVAIKELDQDAESASYDASVAADGASQCETAMASKKVEIPSSISTRNSYMRLYSYLGNVITSKL